MAINDFQFPGVELSQVFVETPAIGTSQLGVAVLGYQKKRHTTELMYDAVEGNQIKLSSIPYCTADVNNTDLVVKVDGVFDVFDATEATEDTFGIEDSAVVGATATLIFSDDIEGATASFGTAFPVSGDAIEVAAGTTSISGVIDAISGATVFATLADIELEGSTVTDVSFFKTLKEAELDASDVEIINEDSVNYLVIAAGAKSTLDGQLVGSQLLSATENKPYSIYLEYEPKRLSTIGISSLADIRGTFGSLEGEMAISLAFALLAAGGNAVSYLNVVKSPANDTETAEDTEEKTYPNVDDFNDALDYLDNDPTIYSLVPATYDEDIIKAVITAAERISKNVEAKVFRTVWYGLRPVDSAIADELVAERKRIGTSYRAQAVWADVPLYNGKEVPTFAVAAAAAGMRSYEPTYRPISNLGYTFFSLAETHSLKATDLTTIGSNGIWIVANNYDGTPVNKRQLTTAVANNLNLDEESIVSNADSIALTLCHVGENLVGCSNISPALLTSLYDTIKGIMDRYTLNLTGNVYIGPQLLSWTFDRLEQDPVQLDKVYATITCEPPKPFNRFVMTLRIV